MSSAYPIEPSPASSQAASNSPRPDVADDHGSLYRYDVFVSYSKADAGWTQDWLVARLKAAGLTVCIDEESFAPGAPVATETERAIRESRYTLVVLSPSWVESDWADFESLLVQRQDPNARWRRLIPLLVAPCDPPERIKLLHWVDLAHPESRDAQLERVIRRLQGVSDLPELRVDLFPEPRRRRLELRWYAVGAVAAMLTLAVLLSWIALQDRGPTVMPEGDFNIAVAEFGVEDGNGQPVKSAAGRERAASIAAFLEGEVDTLRSTVGSKVTVWGPEHRIAPVVAGEEAARVKALNAEMLVHGVVRQVDENRRWSLEPTFYLADPAVAQARELAGEHALGVPIQYRADSTGSAGDLNRTLNVRVRALVQLLNGLSHYSDGNYRAAEEAFQTAADDPAWGGAEDNTGQEVLYLFLGNAQMKAAQSMQDDNLGAAMIMFSKARASFEHARQLNPNYTRALNGLGGALFELARPATGDPDECNWNWGVLNQAQEACAQALAAPAEAKPPSGYVDLRARVMLGQIGMVQVMCSKGQRDSALEHLRAALRLYAALPEAGQTFLAWEAALIHTNLGMLALSPAEQIPELEAVVELAQKIASDELQRQSLELMPILLEAYCVEGQGAKAQQALESYVKKRPDGASARSAILNGLNPTTRQTCFPN